ncbi:uncharacterized protein [Heliangelus exortis]|uniref:uncharacterized protein isoform X1 n=1 Tax=Heliangelus exortis TaxID=472823 RepID=UPI003A8E96DA
MVDTTRERAHGKLRVSPGMYRTSYKRDYQWCEEYKAPSQEDIEKLRIADSQLKAKEFAMPQEEQMTYRDLMMGERGKASSRADDGGERCLTRYYPATQLAATRAETWERPQDFIQLDNELPCCQHLPAAAETAGPAGMCLCPKNLVPQWATYQQFSVDTFWRRQREAQQNKNMTGGSSVFGGDSFDPDWRSTYNTDFHPWPGVHGGSCKGNWGPTHVFPENPHLNQNWISEYKDNYSIFLRRVNRPSQVPAVGPSMGKGPLMDTTQ